MLIAWLVPIKIKRRKKAPTSGATSLIGSAKEIGRIG
jgi:hypothetical protein